MFRKKRSFLHDIYIYDESKNAYIIEVDLDSYGELFNEWDFAPYGKKDLEPDLIIYLEDCVSDIPLKYNIIIRMHLPEGIEDTDKEKGVIKGIRNYYKFMVAIEKRSIQNTRKKAFENSLLSMVFLMTAYLMDQKDLVLWSKVIQEGILVGGWVFAWETFSKIFFEVRDGQKMKNN